MIKKTIQYEDLDGNPVVEECHFHLSKADLIEMELGHEGGLGAKLQQISEGGSNNDMFKEFRSIVLNAYGERSPDGKRFIKDSAKTHEFSTSDAFGTLILELASNATVASEFINGIIPAGLAKQVAAQKPDSDFRGNMDSDPVEVPPASEPVRKVLTPAEIQAMDADELRSGLAEGRFIVG